MIEIRLTDFSLTLILTGYLLYIVDMDLFTIKRKMKYTQELNMG